MNKVLIANRGEVAIRVARTCCDYGVATVGVYSEDDVAALHKEAVDEAHALRGIGPAAYLDVEQLLRIAGATECDAVHPGYGFLSESATFSRAVEEAGLAFIGPSPEVLSLFGDKTEARRLAASLEVPVLAGTDSKASVGDAMRFLEGLGEGRAVMVKAVSGGGGRGMRVARNAQEVEEAFARAGTEAEAAFGDGRLYVEELLASVRHIEVQLVGDGRAVTHLWDRDCSLQRQRQKVVEIAPAVTVPDIVRQRLWNAAVALGEAAGLASLCTIEFLVETGRDNPRFVFIEANPRLQVEHTVTEEVTDLDLVMVQLMLADGASLADVMAGVAGGGPRGIAVQARVNLERMDAEGTVRPSAGRIDTYAPPGGPGVRVDGAGYAGYEPPLTFDSLVAKVVVHSATGGLQRAVGKAQRAVGEFGLEGVASNLRFLGQLLAVPEVAAGDFDTSFIEQHVAEIAATMEESTSHTPPTAAKDTGASTSGSEDPLAVLTYGRQGNAAAVAGLDDGSETDVRSPVAGTVVGVETSPGDLVQQGQALVVVEAMKMEHVILSTKHGLVRELFVSRGQTINENQPVARLELREGENEQATGIDNAVDLDQIRPDLDEVLRRHARVYDEGRLEAVRRRHDKGKRTARENIAALCDPGSFTEYGSLVIAGRLARSSLEELIDQSPADGLVMGLGHINGRAFGPERSRAAVLSYDYSVFAGTQGARNHFKLDRMAELALRWRLPTVFFTEGGGGRPGDTDRGGGFIRGFEYWAQLSGAVPLVGITSGRCFAGNVVILGCCDVIIATRDSVLGMGGPAVIEGGGLGVFRPEEIGPLRVMLENGVIDLLVDDEEAAVDAGKKYLSYFQGRWPDWSAADQRLLRHMVPEQRLRAYDVRRVIEVLADNGSVLELRPHFGKAMVTALIRIEGYPMGVIANNPTYLGGAIDSDASDKATRFMKLCEAFDIPVLSLSDTPGNMVGPEAEKTALIRHCSRLFVVGANLTVPLFSVILRKSYGLGAIAMTGGSYQASMFSVSWPTGEFGGMNLEGAVKLGYRNELAAIADLTERRAAYEAMVREAYASGRALARAVNPSLDDVIDPAETRRWIVAGLTSLPPAPARTEKKLPWVDPW